MREYVKEEGKQPDSKRVFKCNIGQCEFRRKTKAFTASKWGQHILCSCKFATKEIKDRVGQHHKTQQTQQYFEDKSNSVSSKRSFCTIDTDNSYVVQHSQKQGKIQGFVDHCTEARGKVINENITKFLVGCALPFSIVNTEYFMNMVHSLNSAALKFIPKDQSIIGTHLPSLFNDTTKNGQEIWRSSSDSIIPRSIGFDKFTTEIGDSAVNITETANGRSAFVKCVDPGTRRADAEFYESIIQNQLLETSKATQSSVEDIFCGVVADNVSYNRSTFRILEREYESSFLLGAMPILSIF